MISLREAREEKGWSVEDLAAASNVDVLTIEAIEAGEERPPFTTSLLIATALGKSVTDIAELAPHRAGGADDGADPLLGPRVGP